jgi:hypothetical protein
MEHEEKISRRSALKKMSFFACAVPITVMTISGLSEGQGKSAKASKATAEYQDKPKDGKQCSGCSNFLPPNGCMGVEGEISPSGWCKFFKPKSS